VLLAVIAMVIGATIWLLIANANQSTPEQLPRQPITDTEPARTTTPPDSQTDDTPSLLIISNVNESSSAHKLEKARCEKRYRIASATYNNTRNVRILFENIAYLLKLVCAAAFIDV
jgi:hypothetical protein